MAFESLSERAEFIIDDFPPEWLPLTYLYDPDLPLYPLQYFHALDPTLKADERPGERDRIFGFIRHINLEDGKLRVSVAINKDLTESANAKYQPIVKRLVRSRLGLDDKITFQELADALKGPLANANDVLKELWYQIVDRSFGKALPFGCTWDAMYGLPRFIASWFSEGGRKGELIQTHYFCSSFGSRIATGGGIHVDFYLLPTFEEFTDPTNPLNIFPRFSDLVTAAKKFRERFCDIVQIDNFKFSAFRVSKTGAKKVDTSTAIKIVESESGKLRDALFENYSAFNRGPQRSIIALMMIDDLRSRRWHPDKLSPELCAKMYQGLRRSYQTPKVIQLYAQQCFGQKSALPIDNWIETFLQWPLNFKASKKKHFHTELFKCSDRWGKIERLIWLAAQSRKVHSSVAAEVLWCIRYGSRQNKKMRGANPLSCKICADHVRQRCPSYEAIETAIVTFNGNASAKDAFVVSSSSGNNVDPAQAIIRCVGRGIEDEYSTRDRPDSFSPFPVTGHNGSDITVKEFIKLY